MLSASSELVGPAFTDFVAATDAIPVNAAEDETPVVAAGEGWVLPDLLPWASPSRGYLYDYVIEGDLLRFTTALANGGPGNLELRGGPVLEDGGQQLFQRVQTTSGTFEDVPIDGSFTYHPTHNHIHFDGYAIYNLRQVTENNGVGDIVGSGGKVSFCLLDVTEYRPNPIPRRFGTCGNVVQGITAGWSDVYSYDLPDQWINIRGIPDGEYWLEVIVDPDEQLLESDETNNTVRILVDLEGGPTSQGDRFELNESFANATNLGTVINRQEPGLSIHDAADHDFFHVTVAEEGELKISVEFLNSLGNLDVRLYDSQQNLLAESATGADLETLQVQALAGEDFYFEIYSFDGLANGYEMLLTGPGTQRLIQVQSQDSLLPWSIPDSQQFGMPGSPVVSTLLGPDVVIEDVNLLMTDLRHTYLADLRIELVSPQGTAAAILASGWEASNGILQLAGDTVGLVGTVIDDQASLSLEFGTDPYPGPFNVSHPSVGTNPLSVFVGENASGLWRLRITDWAGQDIGELNAWGLEFTSSSIGDRFEPNNNVAQSILVEPDGVVVEPDLTLHASGDIDYFSFTATRDGEVGVETQYEEGAGPILVSLLASDLSQLAIGTIEDARTILTAPVEVGHSYYIQIAAPPEVRAAYDLYIQQRGDFNSDALLDAVDIDLLFDEVARLSHSPNYDLNWDAVVDQTDVQILIEDVFHSNFGDANLDRVVDGEDLELWNTNRFRAASWGSGDFNGDGFADVRDFNVWYAHRFGLSEGLAPIGPQAAAPGRSPRAANSQADAADVVFAQVDDTPVGRRSELQSFARREGRVGFVVEEQVVILRLRQANQQQTLLTSRRTGLTEELLAQPFGWVRAGNGQRLTE